MRISVVGEGSEWKKVLSPTAPNELNYPLPRLLMGQFKKLLDIFYPNKKGLFRPKNHLTLLSLVLVKHIVCFYHVLYSTLLHLPPLRFYYVGGCWDLLVGMLRLQHWHLDALTYYVD
jgi:hypothetical protein